MKKCPSCCDVTKKQLNQLNLMINDLDKVKSSKSLTRFNNRSENIYYINYCENSSYAITLNMTIEFSRTVTKIAFRLYPFVCGELSTSHYELVGEFILDKSNIHLSSLTVSDVNKGYGTALMTCFLNFLNTLSLSGTVCKIHGVAPIYDDDNHRARVKHFYEKFGFQFEGYHFSMEFKLK